MIALKKTTEQYLKSIHLKKMGRKKLPSVIDRNEMEKYSTKRLLGYLKSLQKCEESFEKSDMEINLDLENDEIIYFKKTHKWQQSYNLVKSILDKRENI